MIRLWRRAHDPERDAAEYLAGDQRRRLRERFEAHLISCQDCWREVQTARWGRALAERGREMAPPRLLDDVRAAVSFSAGRVQRRSLIASTLPALVAAAVVSLLVVTTLRARQPEPISAALLSFRSNRVPAVATTARPAPDLTDAGLRLRSSGRGVMAGLSVEVFTYRSRTGGRMFLYFSDRPFPPARGARERPGTADGWEATDDDVFLLCREEPMSYLLIGTNRTLLQRTERELRQQTV